MQNLYRQLAFCLAGGLALHSAQATSLDVSFLNGQGVTLDAKLYLPDGGGPFPAVVMMHGCSGVYSNSNPSKGIATLYTEWADRLNQAGYAALLVDSFTPRDAPQNQCGNSTNGVSEVDDRPYDSAAAVQYLRGRGDVSPDGIVALGWSHGASSLMAALARPDLAGNEYLRAAVSYYPGCGLYNAFGGISRSTWLPNAPFLIQHASSDSLYKSGHCATRLQRAELLGAGPENGNPAHMSVYYRAQHSFDQATRPGNGFTQADVLAKEAADFSTMLFLDKHLGR